MQLNLGESFQCLKRKEKRLLKKLRKQEKPERRESSLDDTFYFWLE